VTQGKRQTLIREKGNRRNNMDKKRLICVDCYDLLESLAVEHLTMFYCDNIKCRRFGVLTIGGLSGEKCEKSLFVEGETKTGKER
jgi:hypothetical protein